MVYKGKKRQRGGVYKGSKRQRGGNLMKTGGKLAKKTKNKITKSFKQAEAFITQLVKKGKKQIGGSSKQIGGIVNPRFTGYRNKGSAWGRRLGASVDRFYM